MPIQNLVKPPQSLSHPVDLSAIRPERLPLLNLDAVILNHIRMVLDLNHGNKLRSARQLGISRSTLYRLLAADSPSSV